MTKVKGWLWITGDGKGSSGANEMQIIMDKLNSNDIGLRGGDLFTITYSFLCQVS